MFELGQCSFLTIFNIHCFDTVEAFAVSLRGPIYYGLFVQALLLVGGRSPLDVQLGWVHLDDLEGRSILRCSHVHAKVLSAERDHIIIVFHLATIIPGEVGWRAVVLCYSFIRERSGTPERSRFLVLLIKINLNV